MSTPDTKTDDTAYNSRTCAQTCRLVALCLTFVVCLPAFTAFAQDDVLKLIETKQVELKEREETLKRDEQRLGVLKKQLDEKIDAYSKLLVRLDAAVKKLDQTKGDNIESVVKAYEVMAPEDAAARISVLDNNTALQIMMKMKSKKAGAIIALMEPRKAAALTERMTALPIKPQK